MKKKKKKNRKQKENNYFKSVKIMERNIFKLFFLLNLKIYNYIYTHKYIYTLYNYIYTFKSTNL